MHATQTTLTDDPDDEATNGDTSRTDDTNTTATPTPTPTESGEQTTLAPPEQRGGEQCCPWCLAAAETFEHRDDGRPTCGHCDAAIPVGADWFERGEKIVV
jgi:hypothetical protein